MMVKKIIAVILLVLVSIATTVAFYDLYLYNVYIVNRYLRNPSPNPQVQVVTVTIPPGAGLDPRIGFEPAVISIIIGVNNTVVWVNRDSSWHTAHSNIPEFYSNYIQPGSNFTHTFQYPGIYPYHCDPHPWMTGKITVYPATTGNGNAQTVLSSENLSMNMVYALCAVSNRWREAVANELLRP
jgi:plastocyanin